MSGRALGTASRWAGWMLAAALGVALYSHWGALERANRRLSQMRPLAERTSIRDRLIGTDLSALRFRHPDREGPVAVSRAAENLVWLVDPRECARCLSDLSGWMGLAGSRISVTTVLVGVGPAGADRIRRHVALPGRVAVDPSGEVAASLGVSEIMPSLFLVLDGSGTVLMTEARSSDTSCDWSFSGQVAALIGDARGAVRRVDAGP